MTAVAVRPLREAELDEADRVFRLAFGTFVGLPDPLAFAGDADYVRTRWRADPAAAFAAEVDGTFAGSNLVTTWGSFGFFGPLSVRPELWGRGVPGPLLEATVALLDGRGVRLAGLYTFAESPKHVALYAKFGFRPRFLTAVMERPVAPGPRGAMWFPLSSLPPPERARAVAGCRAVADAVHAGLDPSPEIMAVAAQGLGDTVILPDAQGEVRGFAICHVGAGSEAGSGSCLVKLGMVRSGPLGPDHLGALLDGCEAFAAMRGADGLAVGVSLARERAWRLLIARGFRTSLQGVSMHRPNEPGTARADAFVLDDWR